MTTVDLVRKFSVCGEAGVFDKIIAGGGLAGTFAAYEYLRIAAIKGQPYRMLLIAPGFHAPCAAGNQVDMRLEGLLDESALQDPRYRSLMRDSVNAIKATIKREGLDCRLSEGYEIKGATRELMDHAIDLIAKTGVKNGTHISFNNETQSLHLPEHPYSAFIDDMAQLNVGEFLQGLRTTITRMGGVILTDCAYTGVSRGTQGRYVIHTSRGDFMSPNKLLLATGARHMASLPEIQGHVGSLRFTMGIVLGPLSNEDARSIASRPMAFSDTNIDELHDILWGGIDAQNYLTIGWGELFSGTDADRAALQEKIYGLIHAYYPGILERYAHTAQISFSPMLRAHNELPVVGRLPHYDVSGGWGGFGIVPGFAAAQAWAQADLLGDTRKLDFFQSMQPEIFAGAAPAPANDAGALPEQHHLTA